MAQTKEPVARASARPAAVTVDTGKSQIDLPLFPESDGAPAPHRGSGKKRRAPEEGDARKPPENSRSREEKSMRRTRIKSPISVTTIKRVVAAAEKAGIVIGGLEVQPDGTIRITSLASPESHSHDVFAEWASRL